MGRLWWQREARAKEEQARADAKAAHSLNDSNNNVLAPVVVSNETTDTSDSADESVAILTQIVEDINIDSESAVQQDGSVAEEDAADQAADVVVPGITITQRENTSFNNKKRRQR